HFFRAQSRKKRRVYLRNISAPCAYLLGESRRATDPPADSLMLQEYARPKHLIAFPADVPPMAVRHLHDQPSYVQSLQHPTDRVALTTAFADVLDRSVQRRSDVGVAEAPEQVVAIQHRLEQLHVPGAGRVEPGMATAGDHHRLGQFRDLTIGRR